MAILSYAFVTVSNRIHINICTSSSISQQDKPVISSTLTNFPDIATFMYGYVGYLALLHNFTKRDKKLFSPRPSHTTLKGEGGFGMISPATWLK